MSFWSSLFDSNDHGGGEPRTKVRDKDADRAVQRGDRFTSTGGKTHIHEGYNLDKGSGGYREYRGGENSPDRSYNK